MASKFPYAKAGVELKAAGAAFVAVMAVLEGVVWHDWKDFIGVAGVGAIIVGVGFYCSAKAPKV